MYLPGGGSKDDMQSVTQQMSGMKVQEVGMRAGKEKEVNFNEERSRVGSKISQVADRRSIGGKSRSSAKEEEKEEEGVKVDNTGLGAEATREVVEGANMGGKQ